MTRTRADKMFRAFADETRLRILYLLSIGGELCVCDLTEILRSGQSKVSRHLAYLSRCGLIGGRKQGLWSYYALVKPATKFHRRLAACLKECFDEVPALRRDKAKLAALVRHRNCAE